MVRTQIPKAGAPNVKLNEWLWETVLTSLKCEILMSKKSSRESRNRTGAETPALHVERGRHGYKASGNAFRQVDRKTLRFLLPITPTNPRRNHLQVPEGTRPGNWRVRFSRSVCAGTADDVKYLRFRWVTTAHDTQ